ncbi:hypothetical protein [Nitratifractor sp.]
MKKTIWNNLLAGGLLLGLSGCGVSTWYNPPSTTPNTTGKVDLSNKTPSFKEGYADGCKTAHGEYSKSSKRFNSDTEYHEGWFSGRSTCQYSQTH